MCLLSHELATHPDIQERLQEEIDSTFEENDTITYEIINKMKYLDMVICEGLRKWPGAVITDRVCNSPYWLPPQREGQQQVQLQKGDLLLIPIYAIQRDPQNFEDPDKFDPERFSDENKGNIKPMTFIPFGCGPRNCIGSRFAILEMKIMFVSILKEFSLVVTDKTQIPLRFSKSSFNLLAEKGYWLGLEKRK